MPVTTHPASHQAEEFSCHLYDGFLAQTASEVLSGASVKNHSRMEKIVGSSFESDPQPATYTSSNGFIKGVVLAYNKHHNLVIRPEDVWFAIITQLSFYINANAEALRHKFVVHEGQKSLVIKTNDNLDTVDYEDFTLKMASLIKENLVDQDLYDWIMPDFTTTTKIDKVVGSALIMGTTQKYFKFICRVMCGIPSVTLLGERSDWSKILLRLEKLLDLGEESSTWYNLLKPVVKRFVATFDNPESTDTKHFWQTIVTKSPNMSGPSYLSGWITAFSFWNVEGKPFHNINAIRRDHDMFLDGVGYHRVIIKEIPSGFSTVPFGIQDQFGNAIQDASIIAGSLGLEISSSCDKDKTPSAKCRLDTIQPQNGFIIYTVKPGN